MTGRCLKLLKDDDECQSGANDCANLGPLYQCRNTEGSFRCERKRCNDRTDGLTLLDEETGRCVQPPQCAAGFEPAPRGRCNGSVDLIFFSIIFDCIELCPALH